MKDSGDEDALTFITGVRLSSVVGLVDGAWFAVGTVTADGRTDGEKLRL